MAGVTVVIDGEHLVLERGLGALLRNATALTPAFKNIGEEWLASTKDRFSAEVAPDGTPWKPNAPATRARKRNPKILQEFGERGGLLGSLAYAADDGGVELGTPKVYGAIHQLGGKAGRNHAVAIPERPYLGVSEEDEEMMGEVLREHLLSYNRI